MLVELAISVTIGVTIVGIRCLFYYLKDRFGNPEGLYKEDLEYVPTDYDKKMIDGSKDIIQRYFPDGIEETMVRLSLEERINQITSLTSDISKFYQVDIKMLKFLSTTETSSSAETIGEMTAGYFNEKTNSIAYNVDILATDDSERLYEMVNTVIHECRHAFQFKAISTPGFKDIIPYETLIAWANNWQNYIQAEMDLEGYFKQPIEYDARNFADLTTKDFIND
jgi:hypothetical protein